MSACPKHVYKMYKTPQKKPSAGPQALARPLILF